MFALSMSHLPRSGPSAGFHRLPLRRLGLVAVELGQLGLGKRREQQHDRAGRQAPHIAAASDSGGLADDDDERCR
jgi:hypothetical protein